MVQNGPKWSKNVKIFQNGQKWLTNGQKWLNKNQNGENCQEW